MTAPFPLTSIVQPHAPLTIVDVGAMYVEPPAYEPLLKSGTARLIGFEPNVAECRKLEGIYGPPHRFFPQFVGDGAPATFYETNFPATGSLFRPNRKLLEKFQNLHEVVTLVKEHGVQTVRLDDVAEAGGADFLKLDVQGAELKVLAGASRILERVSVIQLEVEFMELYEGQPLFADVDRYLRAQGFSFHAFEGIHGRTVKPLIRNHDISARTRQCLWSDAIYIRDWIEPGGIPLDRLINLAILLNDVIESPDVCHYLLSHVDAVSGSRLAAEYLDRLMDRQ